MDIEKYRVCEKLPIDPPLKCEVWWRKKNKKKGEKEEFYLEKVKLIHTSGLSHHDKTIIFIAKNEKGEMFSVNENSIKK